MTTWEIIGWITGSLALICGAIAIMVCMAAGKIGERDEERDVS